MLPRKFLNLNLTSPEMSIFYLCLHLQGGQARYMKKGTLPESLKSVGHAPLVPPGSYVHDISDS